MPRTGQTAGQQGAGTETPLPTQILRTRRAVLDLGGDGFALGQRRVAGCAGQRRADQVAGEVYGLVSRIVGDQSQAEQVTEEVLAEVWRSAPRFSPAEGSGFNWIMTMARRRAISQVRAARDGRTAGLPPAGAAAETDQATGSLLAHPGAESLPGPQREALLLAWRGHTWRQVADLAGVPPRTAAELLREGLLGLSSPQ